MPRRREIPKREILPDPKHLNVDVAKFINVLMESGKKSVAERIIYGAFDQISKKGGKDPVEVFNQALQNSRPMVEVKSRRVGGAQARRKVDGSASCGRADGRVGGSRGRREEARGSAPDGGSEQGLQPFSVLNPLDKARVQNL
jgi:hypothetical protein